MGLLIGIDLCQKPLRVGGSALGKYLVGKGSKAANLSDGEGEPGFFGGVSSMQFTSGIPGDFPPQVIPTHEVDNSSIRELVQCFHDARQVCKSYLGSGEIKAAVVVVPNSSGRRTFRDIKIAGSSANVPIQEVITENNAVAVAYGVKTKLALQTKLCIVSDTSGILDVSLVSIKPHDIERGDYECTLLRHDAHRGSEEREQHVKHSVAGFIGAALSMMSNVNNVAVEASPFTTAIEDIVSKSLEVAKSNVVKLVFVGKVAGSEKLQEEVKGRFPHAEVWNVIDGSPEELAAYGAAVLAAGQKPAKWEVQPTF